jgi:hypothetical protein
MSTLTSQTYLTTANEYGYHLLDRSSTGSVSIYKLSGDILGGNRILKEVTWKDSTITVKIGGKAVTNADISITNDCQNVDTLHHILKCVDKLKLCHGFLWLKKGSVRWENDKAIGTDVQISKGCLGYLKDNQRNNCCSSCTKLEKDTKIPSVNRASFTDKSKTENFYDHSYSLVQSVPRKVELPGISDTELALGQDILHSQSDSSDSQSVGHTSSNTDEDQENFDPDYVPEEGQTKSQKKDPKSTCLYSDEHIDEACTTLIKMCPSLENIESFKLLLKSQIANSAKCDKHLRRWEPRLNNTIS